MRLAYAFTVGICGGLLLRSLFPMPANDPVLAQIAYYKPEVYDGLQMLRSALMFSSVFFVALALAAASNGISIHMPHLRKKEGKLPPLVPIEDREQLEVVLGEVHHQRLPKAVEEPWWLVIGERALHTGIMLLGATGTGKTSGGMYPYARQILGWRSLDSLRKCSALVLEVKGDFCRQVKQILDECGRGGDYVALSVDKPQWRYNPLYNDMTPYAVAYSFATLMLQLFGKSKEPFWQSAYTHLLMNVVMLYRTVDDYVTIEDIYHAIVDPDTLQAKLAEAYALFSPKALLVTMEDYLQTPGTVLGRFSWKDDPLYPGKLKLPWTPEIEDHLKEHHVRYEVTEVGTPNATDPVRRAQLRAVQEWHLGEWTRLEPKLKLSIVEGISTVLSVFNSSPALKYVFCPPKAAYDPAQNPSGKRHGKVLPPMRELLEDGKVLALDLPTAADPGTARIIGVLLKQDFQRAVQLRSPDISGTPGRVWRSVLFLCDEYHMFATCGAQDPVGDDKFFAVSRSAKCIPLVATQSISSLRDAVEGDTWKTLIQQFRTVLFLTATDLDTAEYASRRCGREERVKENYSLSESGSNARVNMLTGRPTADKSNISLSRSYSIQKDVIFEPNVFTSLKNAQCVALAYDGVDPHPPTLCYLKPYYLPENMSYFEQARKGLL